MKRSRVNQDKGTRGGVLRANHNLQRSWTWRLQQHLCDCRHTAKVAVNLKDATGPRDHAVLPILVCAICFRRRVARCALCAGTVRLSRLAILWHPYWSQGWVHRKEVAGGIL